MLNERLYQQNIFGSETLKDNHYFREEYCVRIEEQLRSGISEFIIYPMNDWGQEIAQTLQFKYGIEPKALADDRLCCFVDGILSIEQAVAEYVDAIVLVSSNHPKHYDLVRKRLLNCCPPHRIVDLFPLKPLYKQDSRIISLELASREIYKYSVAGSVAEVGVYRGYFAEHISLFFPDKNIYLFDTFTGFDERDCKIERDNGYSHFEPESCFLDTNEHIVLDRMVNPGNCVIAKGWFPDTVSSVPEDESFCFVHLDTDLYKPTYEGLCFFYNRLQPGGYIFIHDFNGTASGVRTAVRQFCTEEEVGYVVLPDSIACGTAVLAKPLHRK